MSITKQEFMDMGLTEDQITLIQNKWYQDIRRIEEHYMGMAKEAENTRVAICSVVHVIKQPETLQKILNYVNSAYYKEGVPHVNEN